ncbi:MAG: AAA family ATPase, partial [Lachnospiraceae bacterium]|nr:AAA family ATPase [Lachnospiraceae bacterium]
WWALPLIESFKILRDIYQIPQKDYEEMLSFYSSVADMDSLLHKPVRQMSLGQRTLSDILAAFLHDPKIVFLDEPTIGLDVSMKAKIRELILSLNEKKHTTVILTTHDMGDVDALCRRVVIIDHGKMLYDNDMEHLKSFFGSYRTLKLRVGGDLGEHIKSIRSQYPDLQTEEEDGWISVLVDEEKTSVMKVLNAIQESMKVRDVQIEEISTEDVIKKIYEGDMK